LPILLIDGGFRVLVFVGYLLFLTMLPDVRALFQYHGAEHMSIATHEAKKKLSLNNIRKFSRFHPRCGTSFILIVLLISIFVFSLIITESLIIRLLSRIVLLPIIAGTSYEILKVSAKLQKWAFFRFLVMPGLLLQNITTKPPTNKQILVAVASLKAVMKLR